MDFNQLITEIKITFSHVPDTPEKWGNWLGEQFIVLGNHLVLFLILILTLFVLQRLVFLLSAKILDGKVIYLSAWIGTPIHELSHALFCFIFGHKIQKMVLFNPDKRGTLGYVTHSYNNRNLWQVMGNFFIGIAPLFGGLLGLYLVTWLLLDDAVNFFNLLRVSTFQNLANIQLSQLVLLNEQIFQFIESAYIVSPIKVIIWAYLCAAISLHLSPSKEDLKGAWVGFFIFIFLALTLMMFNQLLQLTWFSEFKSIINMTSMLYFIGIILASFLLLGLFFYKGISLTITGKW
ncbi:hypothetical protein [uncultured Psychromonas sp.]|uniref:hypothetical protein n=1 Tax=uncultured Psychromonas sp. TaxID=173974 RepID=UPI002636F84B|nr:hypothetical protein [uncultured Psychromonas sp.]